MSIVSHRFHDDPVVADDLDPLARALVDGALLQPEQARSAQRFAQATGLSLWHVLHRCHDVSQQSLVAAERSLLRVSQIDPTVDRPDVRLARAFDPCACLAAGVLPWRRVGDAVIVLAPNIQTFTDAKSALTAQFGLVRMALATPDQITGTLIAGFGPALALRAENRLPASHSSRDWNAPLALRVGLLVLAACLACLALIPGKTITVLCVLAIALLAISTIVKMAAALAGHGVPQPGGRVAPVDDANLPVITLLIPLYREQAIADHLITRLESLDYPRVLLDVCMVIEDNDDTTRDALGCTRLLTWMRAITVPKGTLRTKPRALNYALTFARGSIIGVYDAEDAPDPDQLRIVANSFANAAPDVACLQGVLDYYNSTANWLTRCFTIEYASWFRVVLPGYARLGLVVPLGGTTLFFRRDILERLGGWDAHNVTEDADLGLRLARQGYTTAFIPSVTQEEANGHAWPWVKQRSRWLKGYAITYAVHMRKPRQLLRDLGLKRFLGVQVLFLGTLSHFMLAPLLWSFWLILAGLPHPMTAALTPPQWTTLVVLFVVAELVNLAIAAIGLHRAGKLRLWGWALTLQWYFPLGSLAVYKGLLELAWKPFWWDKTAHGVLQPTDRLTPPPLPAPHPVSDG
ncbi:glycosyltransferase family 2 protein [Loktanella sp. SALINAS62]|uniref:glycosyltransferase family 2 protein n=1 Tax=Loktanella sp. SALINAS62 TaxID=2706124 RepID=UPI001B8CFD7E|nr:glycosyltransferase family 2 protein [Loktanella sp. SALINAS62]MBS1302982.1 glycosyltransferase [Loktanella sp. SALINAS62]